MADDDRLNVSLTRPAEKFDCTGISFGLAHAGAVYIALQLRPLILAIALPKVFAHADLVCRNRYRDQAALQRDAVKEGVVAYDRVVEVDADAHVKRPPAAQSSSSPAGRY